MIRIIFFITIFFCLNINSYSMSVNKVTEEYTLPNGMNSYSIQISCSNILNFQGIVAYYDNTDNLKTDEFFGNTPYTYYLQSKHGIKVYIKISNIQPISTFNNILNVVVFKNNEFVTEKNSLINDDYIIVTDGDYPNIDLKSMLE